LFSTRKLSALVAASITLLSAEAVMAGPMVVRSTGPSARTYPIGKPLAPNARLDLKAGDVVTVLDTGGTRVLKGPGQVAISGSNAASGSGFAQLIANSGARQARTGATRSAIGGGPARSPNVWYVDASKSGLHCVADLAALTIWRPDNTAEGTISVKRLSDGKVATVDYRAGQTARPWPLEELPVSEGAQFAISLPGAKAPVTVKTTLLAAPVNGIEEIASILMSKNCSAQMDVLVEGTKQETGQLASAH
jgi:hypothetical protein